MQAERMHVTRSCMVNVLLNRHSVLTEWQKLLNEELLELSALHLHHLDAGASGEDLSAGGTSVWLRCIRCAALDYPTLASSCAYPEHAKLSSTTMGGGLMHKAIRASCAVQQQQYLALPKLPHAKFGWQASRTQPMEASILLLVRLHHAFLNCTHLLMKCSND